MSDSRLAASFDKMVIRLPDGLRDRFAELARANGRSANAEAVKALEAWLNPVEDADYAPARLSEPLRRKIEEAARQSGRSVLEEITGRLSDSFAAAPGHKDEGDASDLRGEIRDAVRREIEDMLADPKRLERLGSAWQNRRGNNEPVSE